MLLLFAIIVLINITHRLFIALQTGAIASTQENSLKSFLTVILDWVVCTLAWDVFLMYVDFRSFALQHLKKKTTKDFYHYNSTNKTDRVKTVFVLLIFNYICESGNNKII